MNDRKEEFSVAMVHALAAQAGAIVTRPPQDYDSTDVILERPGGARPRVSVQLKCTSSPIFSADRDQIFFDLKKRSYNELVADHVADPRVLILCVVPNLNHTWTFVNAAQTRLSHCCYWVSLRGKPARHDDVQTVRVHVPTANRLASAGLEAWFDNIETRGTL